MFLRALLLFLLILFLVRAVWRLLGGIVQGASVEGGARSGRPASPQAVKMERDPVCGTYVIPGRALELARGRQRLYFCSERCRDEWVNAH